MPKRTTQPGHKPLLIGLLILSSVLFLSNLGNQYLWQDEAQTALVGKTVLSQGIPKGYDGLNYLSQEMGAEYGDDYLWKWHTWLSFYVVAGSFKAFGVNTFAARLPFALFGLASVFMVFGLCRALWGNRKIAFTAAYLTAICVPFLLLSRQCRYYSMAVFFSLWGLLAYLGLIHKKKRASFWLILAAFFLFHTHYIYCATLIITLGLHALIFHRNRLLALIVSCGIAVAVNLPWIYWFMGIRYGERYSTDWLFDTGRILDSGWRYLTHISDHIFSPYLLLVLPLAAAAHWVRYRSRPKPG
ncbi:MAG: glycosyltransferase family 39 protein, partial [Planctomycetes bacterium]|nr:glycosyltransferase family 39 protein [Planctomycetota bacterium]